MVGKLLREGSKNIKCAFENLLHGEHLVVPIGEQIVYDQLEKSEKAIWSLLVASGYLKVLGYEEVKVVQRNPKYELALTNLEVQLIGLNWIIKSCRLAAFLMVI